MKVLFFVIAAFVVVNASPVPDSQLKQTAQNVLDVIKTLQSEIKEALKITETVQKESEEAVEHIPSTVAANEKVAEMKKAVSESGKCQEIFDSKVSEFQKSLENFLKEQVDMHVTILQSTLGLIKKQLDIAEVSLTDNLDAELEACNTEGSECKITGAFIQLTDDVFKIVGTSGIQAANFVSGTVSQVENQTISQTVERALVEPVRTCLEA